MRKYENINIVSKDLNKSKNKIKELIYKNEIDFYEMNGQFFVDREEVEYFITKYNIKKLKLSKLSSYYKQYIKGIFSDLEYRNYLIESDLGTLFYLSEIEVSLVLENQYLEKEIIENITLISETKLTYVNDLNLYDEVNKVLFILTNLYYISNFFNYKHSLIDKIESYKSQNECFVF